MWKLLRNNKGQGIIVQYSVTFFAVVAVASVMTMYVRRAVQARIRDAYVDGALNVRDIVQGEGYVGNFRAQYEPYYVNSEVLRNFQSEDTDFIQEGGLADYTKNQTTTSRGIIIQLPPGQAD